MKILTHNLLVCNLKPCLGRNSPLVLQAGEIRENTIPFNLQQTKSLIQKLDWAKFASTASDFGHTLPEVREDLDWESTDNLALLQLIHKLLFNIEILTGSLTCNECGCIYPIEQGIPNLIREE